MIIFHYKIRKILRYIVIRGSIRQRELTTSNSHFDRCLSAHCPPWYIIKYSSISSKIPTCFNRFYYLSYEEFDSRPVANEPSLMAIMGKKLKIENEIFITKKCWKFQINYFCNTPTQTKRIHGYQHLNYYMNKTLAPL